MDLPKSTTKPKKDPNKTPQQLVAEFWEKFLTKKTGKVVTIFPRELYANLLPPLQPSGASIAHNAAESYEVAAKECRERVKRIVRECTRTNEKFTDPDFDIEGDMTLGLGNCLNGLVRDDDPIESSNSASDSKPSISAYELKDSLNKLLGSQVLGAGGSLPVDISTLKNFIGEDSDSQIFSSSGVFFPGSVHRVDWIFDNPQFIIDGYSSTDIKQGGNGDCWWLAAIATICNRKDLMDKVCVARNEECGVYGFLFYRDGEWISTVVDDSLYLKREDFDYYGDRYDSTGKKAREYKKRHQTGSEALHFAKCSDPNETWLPLLEKAYAKVHGDYEAISGGWAGEGVEDMTGGVTTTIATNRVLSKDKLWKELIDADGSFVFAASAIGTGWDWTKGGLALGHAYSILRATQEVDEDGNRVRLVLIRNPWGERAWNGIGEWNGPWSDGSKEWTPYWLKKINHRFGDDGIFWMSYEDMLSTFRFLHRTRIFDEKWTVVQHWTSVNVAWVTGYLQTKFLVEIKKAGPVVFVLSQLDERYFIGLEGQYEFALHFLLKEENATAGEHILRVRPIHSWETRSVSAEIELEPGKYEVLPKISATRDADKKMVEDIVKDWAEKNPQKLRQVGLNYDLANAKADTSLDGEPEKKVKDKKQQSKTKENAKDETDKSEKKGEVKKESKEEKQADETKKDEKKEADAKDEEKSEATDPKSSETIVSNADDDKKDDKKDKDEKENDKSKDEKEKDKDKDKDEKEKDKDKDKDKEKDKEKDKDKDDKKDDADSKAAEDESTSIPWNAVCVMGLRVYAKDPQVSITLVKPKDAEEAAILDVDGATPAGATI